MYEALERAKKLKLDLVEVPYFKFVAMVLVKWINEWDTCQKRALTAYIWWMQDGLFYD